VAGRLAPQEKKQLSYVKDRRSLYGESPSSARKSIRRRKGFRSRAQRRDVHMSLRSAEGVADEELQVEADERVGGKRTPGWEWHKHPDASLGEVLALELSERAGDR
jgi:hypothetical protein